MTALRDLRTLIRGQKSDVFTGDVVSVGDSGTVVVSTGSNTVTCFSNRTLAVGDKVRVQGLVVLTKATPESSDTPVFRV